MNITTFPTKDFNTVRRRSDVTIRVQKSKLSLSAAAVKAIGLKIDDKILFHQDNEDPAVWYVSKDKNGFSLAQIKKTGSLLLYNSKLAEMILTAFESESFNFYVDEKPIKAKEGIYWKLTTEKE
jgi:hypothetical protein